MQKRDTNASIARRTKVNISCFPSNSTLKISITHLKAKIHSLNINATCISGNEKCVLNILKESVAHLVSTYAYTDLHIMYVDV